MVILLRSGTTFGDLGTSLIYYQAAALVGKLTDFRARFYPVLFDTLKVRW